MHWRKTGDHTQCSC